MCRKEICSDFGAQTEEAEVAKGETIRVRSTIKGPEPLVSPPPSLPDCELSGLKPLGDTRTWSRKLSPWRRESEDSASRKQKQSALPTWGQLNQPCWVAENPMNESANSAVFSRFFPALGRRAQGLGRLRQKGKPHLLRQTDPQHECEPEITDRFNISRGLFSRPGGRRSPYLLSLQGLRQRDPEDSVPLAWSNPASEAPSLPAPPLPTAAVAGQPPPAWGGKPRPPRPPPPALLPSLPPSFSPSLSLPPSRAAASGALPRATCSGPNPGISERLIKERTSYVEKKRKTLTAFIFHVLTIGRPQFRRPEQGPVVAEVCGACCLAHADRRAPRAACSTLWAAAPQGSPNTQQTSRSFLQTQHPVARLAAGHSPGARSALSAAKVHTQSTLLVLSRPARTPLLATPPSGPHAGCGPAQDFEPRSLQDPHKALSPGIPTRSPQSLLSPPPSPVLGKGCISETELGGGPGPGPTEATADLPG
ncbi:uncharacterized protein LOC103795248 [Callithrix jacchus]|uniref:uncharacterized protein LOC103795248 n=1 Tax=Callithrix jacchus TaxID=9483 RepID=UPI00159EB14B|nr:uncharacterized protein LOC103795248 [Callithrix jacchus]XP_054094447.1 uncharacterized protein LOC103795248 [Callithrix jacchus]XP_054094448.1 uncharacterized protein LOC103795248 [Callithrix jacchus]